MAANPTLEDTLMREAQEIIRGLYNAAHSLACNDPNCPWAQLSNEPSQPTNAGTSPREDAVLLVLFGIAENVGECLDLLRILVGNRDETSSLDHLSQSSTATRSSTGDTAANSEGFLDEPPAPGLYRDQWTQTPALSPPAYTAFLPDHPQGYPRAPAPSPANSDTTTSRAGSPVIANQEGVSRDGQIEHDRAGNST